jgi:hypothetical protein
MIRFMMGVVVGIFLLFLFLYFGGGTTVKKIGEGLTDTGKKMEAMGDTVKEIIKKETSDTLDGVKKKLWKDEKEAPKKSQ